MSSHSSGNNRTIHTCLGKSKECAVYTSVLTFSTFIFVSSMLLTVYLTHISSIDKALVVLIVGSCLLYISCFAGNMYSIYYLNPDDSPSENGDNSNRLSQITGSSTQSSSTNVRVPDVVRFSRARERFRITPPPPYEVQMSEMSRMLQSGTSRTTEASDRDSEIAEEARKLVQRIYEEIKRTDQLTPQSSTDEQSPQQMVQAPRTSVIQQETTSPKVLHQNMVAQKQQTVVKDYPSRSQHVSFRTNQVNKQVTQSSIPNQLDLGRLIIGSEGFIPLQHSPRIPGRPSVDFRANRIIQQKMAPNQRKNPPDLEKFKIVREGCAVASPQLSPRGKDVLKFAHKRKLTSPLKDLQTRPKTIGNSARMAAVGRDSQNNEYEEIEVMGGASANSSQSAYGAIEYYCTQSEFEDSSEQESSVDSPISELSPEERKINFRSPSVKEFRQLSTLSTRKFLELGLSPETVLDAIATCFDLTPDEWMVAWKLSKKGVSPIERARILGVRLQDDS